MQLLRSLLRTLSTVLFISTLTYCGPVPIFEFGEYSSTQKKLEYAEIRYIGDHDIVKIEIPFNQINTHWEKNDSTENNDEMVEDKQKKDLYIFFIEGDIKENGGIDYKGLYSLQILKKQANKLMDNARDVSCEIGANKNIFIAASDGLYKYNTETETPEKYGTVTDSLIDIERPENADFIYALNDKYELLNITDDGTKSTKVNEVGNIRQIVLDTKSNLYYLDADKNVFILSADGVKKIEGLPAKKTDMKLVKPMFNMEDGVLVLVDDEFYTISANSNSTLAKKMLNIRATACDPSFSLLGYYGYQKKIYEYFPDLMEMKLAWEKLLK